MLTPGARASSLEVLCGWIIREIETLNHRLAAIEPLGWQEVFGADQDSAPATDHAPATDGATAADAAERETAPMVTDGVA